MRPDRSIGRLFSSYVVFSFLVYRVDLLTLHDMTTSMTTFLFQSALGRQFVLMQTWLG